MSERILYTYFRSTAAYRVRIALNLKQLSYTPRFIHLVKNGGEQHAKNYRTINPQGLIPTLIDGATTVIQSLAIIEYLEECNPAIPLLPESPAARAQIRSFAQQICCDIHPLNNLRVLNYLRTEMTQDESSRHQWYQHWISEGLMAIEQQLTRTGAHKSRCCFDKTPTIADLCLIPQLYNARRFNCDIHHYPTLLKIEEHCMTLTAFQQASPEQQPDHE
ncbi:MAG: maleylacetoacetate isomerase [Gammaproteobacteria bacterium]|nr:maleylacetoacetate isomerase [Gammaproteobacteria bacterium]